VNPPAYLLCAVLAVVQGALEHSDSEHTLPTRSAYNASTATAGSVPQSTNLKELALPTPAVL
jgi:hypothetical protein